ncbi:pyridoxal phosphate-dependent aminotransferase [Candidatus Sumerlaeota bacterium]|nr:pyridoxal phosphate-dependent aminotransferase [Candidatus Sumerlaeota bacterium]
MEEARRAGRTLLDLITPNPSEHGLAFPHESLAEIAQWAMRHTESVRRYTPCPLGQRPAREAIADLYRRRGVEAQADHIALTPGTSFGHLATMRLLVEQGDELLIPSPGYPLFDDIAAICGVRLRRYHLAESDGRWRPDLEEIAFQCTERTRAIAVVSPHNPTGTVWSESDLGDLRRLCEQRDLALIFDEVFCEFLTPPLERLPRPVGFPLAITLNGLSKMLALPAWKIAWMRVEGEPGRRTGFLRALEHLIDTFLPMGELQQAMIPAILEAGDPAVCRALAEELNRRRQLAVDFLGSAAPPPQGGVHLCAPLPEGVDDEEFAIRLIRERGVAVHPGFYYELPHHLTLTCIPRPEILREGIGEITAALRDPKS